MTATRVLLLGSGGREHAMARALRTAPAIELFIAPGNPGMQALGEVLPLDLSDLAAVARTAAELRIEVVVPGPERLLCAGLADALHTAGVACCGPTAAAARLEGSKIFMRELTAPLGVPGPRFTIVRTAADLGAAMRAVAAWGSVPVVKADGLAGGKGVSLPASPRECIEHAERLLASGPVLLEERLHGEEASLFFACHGADCVALPSARDHKRLHDGDHGPNTGGMGAVSPSPALTPDLAEEVRARIVQPVLAALCDRGTPFVGFLFAGLMLTARGPMLLEFNVRLGDPEAQAILPRLGAGELLRLVLATARGRLKELHPAVDPRPTCAVVLCAPGYPDEPALGTEITLAPGLAAAGAESDAWLLHAGTREEQGRLRSAGGRVLNLVARGDTAAAARARAYQALRGVRLAGMHFRTDIGL